MRKRVANLGRGKLLVGVGRWFALAVWIAKAVACSSDATPALVPDAAVTNDAGNPDKPVVRLSDIEQTIFANHCVFSVCHGSDSPQRGLSLVGPTYQALVNKSSPVAGKVRITAFSPELSYLLEKIELGQPTAGKRMPPDQPLEPEDIAKIRNWIDQGAQDN